MFGTDEFGNKRLLAVTFLVVLAALAIGTLATSETLWDRPAAVSIWMTD